jgi:hypothetical protein
MYNLHTLGWKSFQQLCLTITREVLGQTVASFLDSNDGGRDGAFVGQWSPMKHENLNGHFVIQCKFTSKNNYNLRLSDLTDEVGKAKKLVEKGICDNYILMTNAGLSGHLDSKIKEMLEKAGVKHVVLFGSTWIIDKIRENKKLRALVPRVYGLGDLSQILDERAYAQAYAILESMREDLAKVVVTDAYQKAAAALDEHGFVLLLGEPAAGKTTIASMLGMAAVDQWNSSMLKLDNPGKVIEHWNPEEPSQFFWLDDAFGVTQYESFLVHGWNHIFPQIKAMLRKGAKIVMTSRDYIYNRARKELKEGTFPLLKESQVVIDVHELSDDEKRQILYNHIKLGKQPIKFRSRVKPFLESVATHSRFIPETARRLADPVFTKNLKIDSNHIVEFVEKRESLLKEVLENLDVHSKASLALIYMRKNRLESPIVLQKAEEEALQRLASNLGDCLAAIESLKGSLVLHSYIDGDSFWRFKHPTIGDAYASILVQSPELLDIFIKGSAPDKLIGQVTCGDVGIEKAVIVPKTLFPLMLSKLSEFISSNKYKSEHFSTWSAKSSLLLFLAHRCSKEFLTLYLENNLKLLSLVSKPGLYLYAVSEVELAKRLYEFNLLPEKYRKRFIDTISEYAVRGEDLYALESNNIRVMFKDNEFKELIEKVYSQLIPKLDEVRTEHEFNFDPDESPEGHMEALLDSFDTLERLFGDDVNVKKIIECERDKVHDWIAYIESEEQETQSRILGSVKTSDKIPGTRSIFDDIDE